MQSLTDFLIANGVVLTGWELRESLGVSDDGKTVVGFGINPDGFREGFVADIPPIPIPGAAWLFGSALGLLGWLRTRASERGTL